jgi:hypothetical protein
LIFFPHRLRNRDVVSVFSTPFVEETVCSPLYIFGALIENQMAISV